MQKVLVTAVNMVSWTINSIEPEPPKDHLSEVLAAISEDLRSRYNFRLAVNAWVVPEIAKSESELVQEVIDNRRICYFYSAKGSVVESSSNATLK